jgi:AbrB family looped-hinge helix DNA binding protein
MTRIKLREKRQMTIPAEVCEALGVKPGDSLDVELEDGVIVLKPSRRGALDALQELQRAFAAAGLSEEEWLADLKTIRKEVFRERYPELAAKHGI